MLLLFAFLPADPLRAVLLLARAIALRERRAARGIRAPAAGFFAPARHELAFARLLAVDPALAVVAREPPVQARLAAWHALARAPHRGLYFLSLTFSSIYVLERHVRIII